MDQPKKTRTLKAFACSVFNYFNNAHFHFITVPVCQFALYHCLCTAFFSPYTLLFVL